MKAMKLFGMMMIAMVALTFASISHAQLAEDYFAGGQNLTKGHQRGSDAHLAQVLNAKLDAAKIVVLTSAAGAGGAASAAMTVTGLQTTDVIMSVSQKTKGANNLPLLGWTTQAANALTVQWSADPGAGSVIVVTVKRP